MALNETRPFANTTALITGASTGIGAATAVAFARQGANILIHYNSNRAEAESVLQRTRDCDVHADIIQADLSTRQGVHALSQYASQSSIDILVNNAGSLLARTRVLDFTEELWDRMLMLNLSSAFFLSQAVLRGMVDRKRGSIVNISSVAARTGGGLGALAYSSTKAAISTMTKGLAKEFAPHNIRVNAVSPGTVDTNYHQTFSNPEALEAVRAATPVGRLGKPEEIADAIVFLCSDGASFIHGQVLEVNGGFLMS